MFPTHIDNTINTAFMVCPQQAKYAYVDDLSKIGESVHLHFGACFASGLEAARRAYYEQGLAPAAAVEAGVAAAVAGWGEFDSGTHAKNLLSLMHGIRYYFAAWPLEHDTYVPKRMEWRFEVPIPDLIHPDTGGPIMYCGRPDTHGSIGDGVFAVEDDKTATSLGASWEKQWPLDSQFTGYWWAANVLGELPRGGTNPVLIRGTSILKAKFDEVYVDDGLNSPGEGETVQHKMVRGKDRSFVSRYNRGESFGHAQSLVYRPQWMIDRWLRQLQRNVRRMIYSYENNEWDLALHKQACAAYGGCSFHDLCLSENPEQWIPVNFVKRKWDPMAVV